MSTTTAQDNIRAMLLIIAMVAFAVGMAATGIDLRHGPYLPITAALFATYSGIAYLVDRKKQAR